jgi:hypothetical protein
MQLSLPLAIRSLGRVVLRATASELMRAVPSLLPGLFVAFGSASTEVTARRTTTDIWHYESWHYESWHYEAWHYEAYVD